VIAFVTERKFAHLANRVRFTDAAAASQIREPLDLGVLRGDISQQLVSHFVCMAAFG
jgi:hypothetical protein